jgi:hypothetical protein
MAEDCIENEITKAVINFEKEDIGDELCVRNSGFVCVRACQVLTLVTVVI